MAEKVNEAEMKEASKARNREGEKGQWWPCIVTDFELKALQEEGFIAPVSYRFTKDSSTPTPEVNERVLTKAWVERGLSLPPSDFFLEFLNTYELQPHNIGPNACLLLSNFVTLCEGHLGVRPDIQLLQLFYRVKKEKKEKNMVNCGSMTFVLRTKIICPLLARIRPALECWMVLHQQRNHSRSSTRSSRLHQQPSGGAGLLEEQRLTKLWQHKAFTKLLGLQFKSSIAKAKKIVQQTPSLAGNILNLSLSRVLLGNALR
jgi:hypothetical protein